MSEKKVEKLLDDLHDSLKGYFTRPHESTKWSNKYLETRKKIVDEFKFLKNNG